MICNFTITNSSSIYKEVIFYFSIFILYIILNVFYYTMHVLYILFYTLSID